MASLVLPQALGHAAGHTAVQRRLQLGQTLGATGYPGGFERRLNTVILYSTKRFVKRFYKPLIGLSSSAYPRPISAFGAFGRP
jgi:hypothetical protein